MDKVRLFYEDSAGLTLDQKQNEKEYKLQLDKMKHFKRKLEDLKKRMNLFRENEDNYQLELDMKIETKEKNLVKQVEEYQSKAADLLGRNNELTTELQKIIEEKEAIIANIQMQLNEKKASHHQIEQTCNKLKLELEDLKQNVKDKETCIFYLRKELEESNSMGANLLSQSYEFEQEIEEIATNIVYCPNQYEKVAEKKPCIGNLEEQIEEFKSKAAKYSRNYEFGGEIEKIKILLLQSKSKAADLLCPNNEVGNELQKSKEDKEAFITNIQKQLTENKAERHQIEENYNKLALELKELRKKIEVKESIIAYLEQLQESKSKSAIFGQKNKLGYDLDKPYEKSEENETIIANFEKQLEESKSKAGEFRQNNNLRDEFEKIMKKKCGLLLGCCGVAVVIGVVFGVRRELQHLLLQHMIYLDFHHSWYE